METLTTNCQCRIEKAFSFLSFCTSDSSIICNTLSCFILASSCTSLVCTSSTSFIFTCYIWISIINWSTSCFSSNSYTISSIPITKISFTKLYTIVYNITRACIRFCNTIIKTYMRRTISAMNLTFSPSWKLTQFIATFTNTSYIIPCWYIPFTMKTIFLTMCISTFPFCAIKSWTQSLTSCIKKASTFQWKCTFSRCFITCTSCSFCLACSYSTTIIYCTRRIDFMTLCSCFYTSWIISTFFISASI